jgi:hypothetical protein
LNLNLEITAATPAVIRDVVEEELRKVVRECIDKSSNKTTCPINGVGESRNKWNVTGTIKKEF